MKANYREILERVEKGAADTVNDGPAILRLIGIETKIENDTLQALHPSGNWEACPSFISADDFEKWILFNRDDEAEIDDLGREQGHEKIIYYAGYQTKNLGNEYGNGPTMGAAMWAAFVKLEAGVTEEDIEF